MDLRLDKDNNSHFDFIFNLGISNGLPKKNPYTLNIILTKCICNQMNLLNDWIAIRIYCFSPQNLTSPRCNFSTWNKQISKVLKKNKVIFYLYYIYLSID